MSRPRRSALGLAGAIGALALAGCGSGGSDGTIPKDDSEALLTALNDVQSSVDDGDCTSAQTDAQQFVDQVNALPAEAGEKTKENLREAGNNLIELSQDESQCEPDEEETTSSTTETGASGTEGFEDGG